ncbi:MAG: phage tail protein [Rhodothermaceae bacterium]|nr:phage tail protein [Rhodothermaceae bacterium]
MLHPDLQRHAGKFYGKYSGEVTDIADEEQLGRITVRVPPVFGPELTVRARPCFPTGHFFVPPVGAKVWVEFEAGDPNYALWVGMWYPSGTVPAEAQQDPPVNRVIQTPSGHTVEFLDEEGEEKVVIRHKENAFLAIDKDGGVLISNNKGSHLFLNATDEETTLVEQHGNFLRLTADGVSLVNNEGAATLQLTGDTARLIATNIVLEGTSVALGKDAMEPAVLGQTFSQLWNAFVFHTHATGVGPSGPPIPPAVPPLGPGTGLTSSVVIK